MPARLRSSLDRLREALSRVTSSGRFVPEMDGLRFFAILAVVLFHVNGYVAARGGTAVSAEAATSLVHRMLATGFVGVRLFFVISGFILSLPFAEQHVLGSRPVRLRAYYLRRLTRLEPPYIVNLLVCAAILLFAFGRPIGEVVPHLLASVTYVHNAVYGVSSAINHVAWSLEIEVQFYLLAPLLARVFLLGKATRRAVLVVAIAALSSVNAFAVPAGDYRYTLALPYYLDYFLVGFLLADFYMCEWREAPSTGALWDVLGLGAWAALIPVAWSPTLLALAFPPLVLVAYVGAFRGRVLNAVARSPWLVTTGGMCYTIYLYHPLVISGAGRVTVPHGPLGSYLAAIAAQGVILVALTLAASAVLFVAFEKPFMRRDWHIRLAARVRGLVAQRV